MTHEVLERAEALASYLEENAESAENLGRLPDETAKKLRESGVIRLLQPVEWGGYEADPTEFYRTVMELGAHCGAAGWVAGIVGVHPWELAQCDPKVQEEIWGTDVDRWVASPYAPIGKAEPVDGGYMFSGQWPFSSGTDHCEWAFLGGRITSENADEAPQIRHFLLPRKDYQIIDGSWNVVGLRGTGSKDVKVDKAFVPSYRTMDAALLTSGQAAEVIGRSGPLYHLPFAAVFLNAITASVIGICEGVLAHSVAYQRDRVNIMSSARVAEDPYVMSAIGEAAAEIDASRTSLLADIAGLYEMACSGTEITLQLRGRVRRNQVRNSWRAVRAADTLFALSGGTALHMENPLQRFWRDAHAGLNHAANVFGAAYHTDATLSMGLEPPKAAML